MSKAPAARSKTRSVSIDLAAGRALEARRAEAEKKLKKASKAFESATAKAKQREDELAMANSEFDSVTAEVAAFVKSNTAALVSDERAFQLLLEVGSEDGEEGEGGDSALPL